MKLCARSHAAAAAVYPCSVRFEIHAQRCPQILAKIIGLLAARSLVPSDLRARRSCDGMWIAIEVDLDPVQTELFAEKLRTLVPVAAVLVM